MESSERKRKEERASFRQFRSMKIPKGVLYNQLFIQKPIKSDTCVTAFNLENGYWRWDKFNFMAHYNFEVGILK